MDETTLTITIGPNGCQVQGPINDKMFCYAALELAKDAIRSYGQNPEAKAPLIVPATPGLRIT
jgi:hypothetical protein